MIIDLSEKRFRKESPKIVIDSKNSKCIQAFEEGLFFTDGVWDVVDEQIATNEVTVCSWATTWNDCDSYWYFAN